ncbi:MAG: DUF6263 family protein [Sedimentisphaerales bacterium]
MSRTKILIVALIVGIIGGCTSAPSPRKILLTVDFKPGQTLKYKFVNSRNMAVDWGPMRGGGPSKINKSSESLEMVVSYTPVEVDPYGVSTIRADCESAKAKRTSESPRQQNWQEAAEGFAGKSWTFTVDARGKIVDGSGFRDVLLQVGQRAFRADRSKGLIKEPDMLFDVIAMQWFLWDSVSSVNNPTKGVAVGDKWKSVLAVPATMVLFAARDVNYTLSEIRVQDANNRIAVIDSSYFLLWPNPPEWPVPYTEPFQMSGIFGFLRGYKTHDLQGHGQELFNIDAGRTERYSQSYTVHASASLPMGLGGVNPQITIDQNMTMELLAPSVPGK